MERIPNGKYTKEFRVEAEKEKQIIDLDKLLIESGQDFVEWEKQQLQWLNKISDEGKGVILRRIEVIRKWAEENNMMKPKLERLKEEGFFNNSSTPTSDKGDP